MTDEPRGVQHSDLPAKLAAPARRALLNAGYTRLQQLTAVTETELKQLHGMGPKAIRQLEEALAVNGLSLAEASDNGKRERVS
ncbi:MAG TPA: DNA-binding protein [Chloroflexia bacterium]|nr:DNA-binding protein [Chloroflexia bacterium]